MADTISPVIILVLGSHDLRVADHAASLYHSLKPKYLLFSGGLGRLTKVNKTSNFFSPQNDSFLGRIR